MVQTIPKWVGYYCFYPHHIQWVHMCNIHRNMAYGRPILTIGAVCKSLWMDWWPCPAVVYIQSSNFWSWQNHGTSLYIHLECLPPYLHIESYPNTSEPPATLFNPRTNWCAVHLPHLRGSKSKKISWQREAASLRFGMESWQICGHVLHVKSIGKWLDGWETLSSSNWQPIFSREDIGTMDGMDTPSSNWLPYNHCTTQEDLPWLGCAGWRCTPAPVEWSPSHSPGSPGAEFPLVIPLMSDNHTAKWEHPQHLGYGSKSLKKNSNYVDSTKYWGKNTKHISFEWTFWGETL